MLFCQRAEQNWRSCARSPLIYDAPPLTCILLVAIWVDVTSIRAGLVDVSLRGKTQRVISDSWKEQEV